MVYLGKDLSTVFRAPNVKTFMEGLNFYFHQCESNKTDINLNENATVHYFNVELHSGNKMWKEISVLKEAGQKVWARRWKHSIL